MCSTSALQGGAGRYCKMSTIALFYNKMAIANPVLSDVYFGLSWAFVAFSSIFALYHMLRKRDRHHALKKYDDENLDEEEADSLI